MGGTITGGVTSLDDLVDREPDQLMDVYCGARTPGSSKDEVREVAPGVWLGLADPRLRDGDHLACFFGTARNDA